MDDGCRWFSKWQLIFFQSFFVYIGLFFLSHTLMYILHAKHTNMCSVQAKAEYIESCVYEADIRYKKFDEN